MDETNLRDRRILVAEDEFVVADELRAALDRAGSVVLGPAASVDHAIALIRSERRIDGAILDVNLGGEPIFAAADLLAERNVPFVFATEYDRAALPARFADVRRYEKPVAMERVVRAIGGALPGPFTPSR